MEPVSFIFGDRHTVPGFIGRGAQKEVCRHLEALDPDKFLIVTEEVVDGLHSDYLDALKAGGDEDGGSSNGETGATRTTTAVMEKVVLPSGDKSKSLDNLMKLLHWNFEVGATKKSVVVAFGGGALLNVAGLFASIAYRGMKVVYIPTTFLAMHDVVTSLKTSICCDGRKNNIGSFYAPLKILIDVDFCSTLPRSELFSGLGELAKNAALFGHEHDIGFREAMSKASIDSNNGGSGEEFCLDDESLMTLVKLGIKAKMVTLATDAYERTSGMVFEYGHTVSHALEKAYGDGTIPHGIGVCYGMLSSSYAAAKMGIMKPKDREEHDEIPNLLCDRWPLPEPKPTVEAIMKIAMRDSKRGLTSEADDELSDVLVTKVGGIVQTQTNNLSKFPAIYVEEWLELQGFPREASESVEASDSGEASDCGKAALCAGTGEDM